MSDIGRIIRESVADADHIPPLGLDAAPHFSSEAQETFVAGCRVYLIVSAIAIPEGAEGVYLGRLRNVAIVDWDTPSREPRAFIAGVPFDAVRNLYR